MTDSEVTEQVRYITSTRRLRLTPRLCAAQGCENDFQGWGRQRYCAKQCAVRADYFRHVEARRAARRARYRRVIDGRTDEKAAASQSALTGGGNGDDEQPPEEHRTSQTGQR